MVSPVSSVTAPTAIHQTYHEENYQASTKLFTFENALEEVYALHASSHYSNEVKLKMWEVLNTIKTEKYAIFDGGNYRDVIVNLQRLFESALPVLDAEKIVLTIHTPVVPTPLTFLDFTKCLEPQIISETQNGLNAFPSTYVPTDDEIKTVLERPVSLGKAVKNGAILNVVHAKGGRTACSSERPDNRTTEQLANFEKSLTVANANSEQEKIICSELDIAIPPQHTGATYIIVLKDMSTLALCIDAQQANKADTAHSERWGIYFGKIEGKIKERVYEELDFIKNNGGIDVKDQIRKLTGVEI